MNHCEPDASLFHLPCSEGVVVGGVLGGCFEGGGGWKCPAVFHLVVSSPDSTSVRCYQHQRSISDPHKLIPDFDTCQFNIHTVLDRYSVIIYLFCVSWFAVTKKKLYVLKKPN